MLKTLKGKVIAGVAALLLVAGGTAAFGASNAGDKLRDWFDQNFAGVTDGVDKNYTGYLKGEVGKLDKDVEKLIKDGKTDIINTRIPAVAEAMSAIEDTASEHVESIEGTQDDIENYMNSEFNRLKEDAEKKVVKSTGDLKRIASSKIKSEIGTFGADNLIFMERQLNWTADESLQEIQSAIDAAKAELLAQISKKSQATLEEIKTSIDSSIFDTRTAISDLTTQLVIDQQNLIEAKALEIENAAKKAMQDLVDGI